MSHCWRYHLDQKSYFPSFEGFRIQRRRQFRRACPALQSAKSSHSSGWRWALSSHIYWAAIIYSAMVCVACPWQQLAGNKWGETLENGSADVQKDCSQKRFPGEEKEFSHVKPSLHIFVFQKRKMYESFLSSVSLLKHLNVSTSSFIFLRDSSWMKSLSSLRVQLSTIKSVYILDWKLVSWISNLSACLVVTKSAYFSM